MKKTEFEVPIIDGKVLFKNVMFRSYPELGETATFNRINGGEILLSRLAPKLGLGAIFAISLYRAAEKSVKITVKHQD